MSSCLHARSTQKGTSLLFYLYLMHSQRQRATSINPKRNTTTEEQQQVESSFLYSTKDSRHRLTSHFSSLRPWIITRLSGWAARSVAVCLPMPSVDPVIRIVRLNDDCGIGIRGSNQQRWAAQMFLDLLNQKRFSVERQQITSDDERMGENRESSLDKLVLVIR